MPAVHRLQHARPRLVGGAALGLSALVGTLMLLRGQQLDLWTFAMTLPAVAGAFTFAPMVASRPRRGPALHDEIDPETGVGNGRAALATIARERDRVASHGSMFSIALVDVGREAFADLPPRRAARILASLLQDVAGDVRIGDQVCRVGTSDRELTVVLLPDTSAEGARLFTDRLTSHTQRHLLAQGLPVTDLVRAETMTLPGNEEAVARFERRMQVLVGTEALIQGVKVRPRRDRRAPGGRPTAIELPSRGATLD